MSDILQNIKSSASLVKKIKDTLLSFNAKITNFIHNVRLNCKTEQLITELINCANDFNSLVQHIDITEGINRNCVTDSIKKPPINIEQMLALQAEMNLIQKNIFQLQRQEAFIQKETEDLSKETVETMSLTRLGNLTVGCDTEISCGENGIGIIIKAKGGAIDWIESLFKSGVNIVTISKEEMRRRIPIQEEKLKNERITLNAQYEKCKIMMDEITQKINEANLYFLNFQENRNNLLTAKAVLDDEIFSIKITIEVIKNIPKIGDQDWIDFLENTWLKPQFNSELIKVINKIELGIIRDFQFLKEIMNDVELRKELNLNENESNLLYSVMQKTEESHKEHEIIKTLEKLICNKPLLIENGKNCHICKGVIDFRQFPMFCEFCNLWFCFSCSNKIDSTKKGSKSLTHPHNLALVTENNIESFKNVSLEKYGNPNKNFEENIYNHKAFCDICGIEINFCFRWICLQCKLDNRPDYFDLCNICMGNYIGNFDSLIKSKIDEVFSGKKHTNDHIFLRICFGDDYYKY